MKTQSTILEEIKERMGSPFPDQKVNMTDHMFSKFAFRPQTPYSFGIDPFRDDTRMFPTLSADTVHKNSNGCYSRERSD